MFYPIKTLIVDDERDARENLKFILSRLSISIEIVGEAENAQDALEIIIDNQPELIFLDIQMPAKDGFWLADKLQKLDISLSIIFVTAYDEYAVQAIRFAAFDFINKPVDIELLEQSIQRYLKERIQNNFNLKAQRLKQFLEQEKIKLITLNGIILLHHNSIIYCEAKGNYTTLYMANGETEIAHIQLGILEKKLSNPIFLRISRSVLINIEYLHSVNRKTKRVVLSDTLQQYEIKISSSGRKKLTELNL